MTKVGFYSNSVTNMFCSQVKFTSLQTLFLVQDDLRDLFLFSSSVSLYHTLNLGSDVVMAHYHDVTDGPKSSKVYSK